MITSLNIKNVATFDSVNGVTIADLKRINFFFGFNGSGKSTIAKYLYNLSLASSQQNTDFNQCSNLGYDTTQHQIITFSEDFIEENFIAKSDFKGVFSLNQSNAVIDQQISDEEINIGNYQAQIEKYKSKIESINKDKTSKFNSLINHCWNQRRTFDTFTKINLIHSGSKPNHLQEIKNILQNPLGVISSLGELTAQYQTLYEKELKELLLEIDAKTYFAIRRLEVKINLLLQEIILGNEDVDIAGLIKSLNSRNWVEQGLKFIENSDTICPFCQKQTIDVELREQFSKYFDESYKKKIAEIEALKVTYRQQTSSFLSNLSTIQNEFNPINKVSNIVIAINQLFDRNVDLIDYKIQHSNERKSIDSIFSFKSELSEIIKLIKENNQLFKDLGTNKSNLLKYVWKFMANNCQQEIINFSEREQKYLRLSGLANQLKSTFEVRITTAKQNIENLRSQTVNTKEAVDNTNMILKNAGFEGFEIAEKDKVNNISRYYLKRQQNQNGEPVFKTLSEGEKNFISFLYFYQLCLGTDDLQNNGNKKKIIVIDDPVSSLDSQALFIITTLIRELIQRKGDNPNSDKKLLLNPNILQVFVFTHNFYFYKEVSFNSRLICTDYFHFLIRKESNQTSISGQYNKVIKDDYSLLWSTLKDIKSNNQTTSASNILVSNTMRRIIESYVNFIGLGSDSWSALLNEDKNLPTYYIKCAFLSTINDESHKISALDSIYYQKIINEQPQVLFDVFLSIFKSIGKEHYEMMMDEQIQP